MKFKAAITAAVLLILVALVAMGLIWASHRKSPPAVVALPKPAPTATPSASTGPQPTPPPAPARTLGVSVIWDDTGKPVAGTTVTLTRVSALYNDITSSAVTNAKGQARLKFPQAWLKARLATKNPDAFAEQREVALATEQEAVLRLKRAGRLFGTVRMADGRQPVTGAEVLIAYSGNPPSQRSLTVKADGHYEAVSLPPGAVNVAAFLGDFCSTMNQPEGAPATITAGQRTGPIDLVLQPGAVVIGLVCAKGTGRPVPGVTIRAEKAPGMITPPATTDLRGAYRLSGLPEQRVRLTTRAAGYVMQGRLVEPRVAGQSRCDFTLEPGGDVEIRVADAAGKPVAGAGIRIWDWAGQYGNQQGNQTDEKGFARLHEISALAPPDIFPAKEGFEQPPSAKPVFRPGQERARLNFVLKPIRQGKGAFAGKVRDDKGNPLSEVTLVWGQPGSTEDENVTTGADGTYRLEVKLARPDRKLTAFGKGWSTQGQAGLTPGRLDEPTSANFTMKAGHWLAGLVVNQQDQPLPAMNVTINPQGAGAGNLTPAQRNLQTGGDGRFRSEDLPGGQVQVFVADAKGQSSETTTTVVDREVRLVIKSPGVILGRLLDKATQQPVSDFNIKVSNGGMWWGDRAMNGQVFSSGDGRFKLVELKQGERYGLTIEAKGYATKTVNDILSENPTTAKENLIELSGGASIKGVLLEKETGKPVADAQVVYGYLPPGWGPDWDAVERGGGWLHIIERRVSQGDGSFSMNVDDDQQTLYILPKNHRRLEIPAARRIKFMQGDQLVIYLVPAVSLSGQVFLDGGPALNATVSLATRADATLGRTPVGSQPTDSDGSYRWENLDPGPYELSVQARQSPPIYPCLGRRLELKENEQKVLNLGNDLGPASLSGAVLDHGKPVANAVVTLRPMFDWDYTLLAGHSDDDGVYQIQGLRPGRYRAELTGHPPKDLKETVTVGGQDQHDFEYQPGHALTAHLVFDEGFPADLRARLQTASIQVKEMPPSRIDAEDIDWSADCQVQGDRLRFEGRFQGSYTIKLSFSGQPSGSIITLPGTFDLDTVEADQDLGDIRVSATGELNVHLTYGGGGGGATHLPSTIILFLQSEDDPTAAGTQLNLDPARTDQKVSPIGVGSQRVLAFAFGYRSDPPSSAITIEPGKTAGPLNFTLTPEGMLLGITMERLPGGASGSKMVRPSRIMLSGQGIQRTLVPRTGANVDLSMMVHEAMSGKDWAVGQVFQFRDLPKGTYQITIEAPGYQTLTLPGEAIPGQLNLTPMGLAPLAN